MGKLPILDLEILEREEGQALRKATAEALYDYWKERKEALALWHSKLAARSLRVAENAGAWREGILRQRLMLHGTAHDALVFSFVRQG